MVRLDARSGRLLLQDLDWKYAKPSAEPIEARRSFFRRYEDETLSWMGILRQQATKGEKLGPGPG